MVLFLVVYHSDLLSGNFNPWSLTLQWCSEPSVFSITNLLEKLFVTVVKHPGSFNCLSFFSFLAMHACMHICMYVGVYVCM